MSEVSKEVIYPEVISKDFVQKYAGKNPDWGFNGLGYIVYKRTYSRIKENGENEEWFETVERCINGAQKIGANYTKEEMERLYDLVFNLKCNFGGRMLWQLGTSTVDRFGLASLLNCWFVSMRDIDDFCFVFEHLMLGGGVGFSVKREDIHELPRVKKGVSVTHQNTKDADFICPDSRQGWVQLLRKTLQAFYITGKSFTYSTILVRGAGERIHGFGGTASGPQILIEGIEKIVEIFRTREGKKLRSIDVLDINNIIGSIVVAGNVRRSAEVAIGDPDDYLYLRAKNWSDGNVPNWRAMSNNSIYADSYDHISEELWNNGYILDKKTGAAKGEPYGFMNLPLSQKYGRLGEERKDNCEGGNPCVRGDTKIPVIGKGWARIDSLVDQEIETWNGFEWSKVVPRITGYNQEMLKVTLSNGQYLVCTKGHEWLIDTDNDCPEQWTKVKASNLKIGDPIALFNKPAQPIVESIEDAGIDAQVYCFTEHKRNLGCFNGIITGQCMEITLADGEACNLCELYLNNIESEQELIDCATLLYKTQKCIWTLPALYEKTSKIVKKNMRIGLGVTGVCQSPDKLEWLNNCYLELRKFDKEWSNLRGWPESIKLSTLKPSGTLSLLAGSTPGVHPAYSRYYIRRVRMSSDDKLVKFCRDAGYHTEYVINYDKSLDHSTVVVEFPSFAGEKATVAKDMSAVNQLELVKKMQTIWADNSVSVTVYYRPEELDSIKEWLKNNYEKCSKTVSFLLHNEHGFVQAPYEEITEEEYKTRIKKVKSINSSISNIGNDVLEGLECAGGACPLR